MSVSEIVKKRLEKLAKTDLLSNTYTMTREYADIKAFLQENAGVSIYVDLPWNAYIEGVTYSFNQIIVQEISDEAICFLNPLPKQPNAEGYQRDIENGPERYIDANGLEFMDPLLFQRLLLHGGALLPAVTLTE